MTSFQKLDCKMLDFSLKTRACMQDIQTSARYTNIFKIYKHLQDIQTSARYTNICWDWINTIKICPLSENKSRDYIDFIKICTSGIVLTPSKFVLQRLLWPLQSLYFRDYIDPFKICTSRITLIPSKFVLQGLHWSLQNLYFRDYNDPFKICTSTYSMQNTVKPIKVFYENETRNELFMNL